MAWPLGLGGQHALVMLLVLHEPPPLACPPPPPRLPVPGEGVRQRGALPFAHCQVSHLPLLGGQRQL